jgi:hypothetical protein
MRPGTWLWELNFWDPADSSFGLGELLERLADLLGPRQRFEPCLELVRELVFCCGGWSWHPPCECSRRSAG